MVDSGKFPPPTDLRSIVSLVGRRRTRAFAFGFVLTFIACTAYIALNPAFGGVPWLGDVVASTNYYRAHLSSFLASASASTASYGSQFSAFISGLLPNSTALAGGGKGPDFPGNRTGSGRGPADAPTFAGNSTGSPSGSPKVSIFVGNSTGSSSGSPKASSFARNSTGSSSGSPTASTLSRNSTSSASGSPKVSSFVAGSASGSPKASTLEKNSSGSASGSPKSSTLGKNSTGSASGSPKVSTYVGNSIGPASAPQKASTLVRNSTGSASGSPKVPILAGNSTSSGIGKPQKISGGAQGSSQGGSGVGSPKAEVLAKNASGPAAGSQWSPVSPPPILQDVRNRTTSGVVLTKSSGSPANGTSAGGAILKSLGLERNGTVGSVANQAKKIVPLASAAKNGTNQMSVPPLPVKQPPASPKVANGGGSPKPRWNIETMKKCNLFHGKWVRDESYPMYAPGSCSHIDESFNCFLNGRPELSYQKLRWQPHGCYIPRLNATDMLERLRGKRLVFVGDSLNRNMWESLVCILTNSVKDKSRVFEASGRHEFKTDGSYSFIFKDYNCTVEFFRSVFLVQEWEMVDTSGNEKETLRLDMIAKSSSKYKDADIIVFNTGHWWTHDKTAKGKDYYQEGSRIYNQLNVVDAFHKALNTWAKWVDANVDSKKSMVFFRGYSAGHFRGGQWNSGGQCDAETEPIKEEKYLAPYPPKMDVLESVLRGMKTPVLYLNITRMTDYRKDAHPSIYRKPNLTEDERRAPNRFQDCSHWCLPGVPDSWNDLLYSKLLIEQHRLESLDL